MLNKGKSGQIYNIGGGRELNNRELTDTILALIGRDSTSIEYVEDRLGHDLRYSVSHEKITRELGYMPKINFEDDKFIYQNLNISLINILLSFLAQEVVLEFGVRSILSASVIIFLKNINSLRLFAEDRAI